MTIVDQLRSGTASHDERADLGAVGPWDTLLYWMSNVGVGSWDRFRNVVEELAGQDEDLASLRRTLRITFSDFGYASFFIDGSSRWKALPPLAAGLPAAANAALLVGARTPGLLSQVAEAAAQHGVAVVCERSADSPVSLRLVGSSTSVSACAASVGLDYLGDYARRLGGTLVPVAVHLDRQRRDTDCLPANWTPRSFDLRTREWVPGVSPNAACEFTPRFGRRRYFVSDRRRMLLEVGGRREAIYAAALLQGVALAKYDQSARALSVPLSCPLPEHYARTAFLCSGVRANLEQGQLVFRDVPEDVAALILVGLGQSPRILS